MLTSTQLQKNQQISTAAVTKMEAALASLNKIIEEAEADKTRSRDWVLSTVKAAREKALPALSAEFKTIQTMATASAPQQRFWESTPLLLSLQTFDADPAKDATIKMGYTAQLADAPLPLLGLTLENARTDKNLPLIYQCWRAGFGRTGESGFTDAVNLALDGIDIPEQAVALAAIATVLANRSHGEFIFSSAGAMRHDPVRKLQVARERQDASRMSAAA